MKISHRMLVSSALFFIIFATLASAIVLADEEYAPIDQASPDLEASETLLAAALNCPPNLDEAEEDPLIMLPGTRLSAYHNYSWNYKQAFTNAGIPVCTVELGDEKGNQDIQHSVEHLVYAIREVNELSEGRPIRLFGYSQGGVVARWALRFYPDVRDMVDEVVMVATPNNGTTGTAALCLTGCAASLQQQMPDTNFTNALNSVATSFDGIDMTSIYTKLDELVSPNTTGQASALSGATNIAVQDVCALHVADHITMGTTDPIAYALALDALTHSGPANVSRLPSNICSQVLMPGINPLTLALKLAALEVELLNSTLNETKVNEEPELRCYVTASCEE